MLPYFYHATLQSSQSVFNLTEATSKHCIQVLRMQQGEQLNLTNGIGLIVTVALVTPHKKNSVVKLIAAQTVAKPNKQNTIAISLLKNATRFEWFLEKATELGIANIIPLICKRTERQLFKKERWEAILISAMLQSQQCWLPTLATPVNYKEVMLNTDYATKLIAHCDTDNLKTNLIAHTNLLNSIVLIGPEGDFTPEEIALAKHYDYKAVTLGSTRLRTETAAIVAATLVQL